MTRLGESKMNDSERCKSVHELLETLNIRRSPVDDLPSSGIYFFYEEGEISPHTLKERIVRIGTHGESRTLKQRLRDHYSGNREGSIFRKHLGSALLIRMRKSEEEVREWYKARRSSHYSEFAEIELEVSKIIRSRFFFRAIPIEDLKKRKYFEERLIATLASCKLCKPSATWLGNYAWNGNVRKSGLWNSDFVNSLCRINESDLDRLRQLVGSN